VTAPWRESSPVPRPNPSVAHAELDGERVLYDPDTRAVIRLDRVASVLWQGLDGNGTVGEFAADTAGAFVIAYEAALNGLTTLLERLDNLGFLTTERSRR
jgi:hypothetical protein